MSDDLVVIDHESEQGTALALVPDVSADDLVKRLAVIRGAMETAMERDVDFGVIPGTNKPTLLKPGSEKLGVLFRLDIQIENEKLWDGEHLTVISRATVFHAPTGARIGSGEGLCTTRESRYAWRQGQRVCPVCGEATVFKSKQGKDEFFCWAKKGGCGASFTAGTDAYVALATMDTGRVANPDIADSYNTVVKMGSKRARIDAVLAVTGASALFTQDLEDFRPETTSEESTPRTAAAKPAMGWKEWSERMAALGVDEPGEWANQLAADLYGKGSVRALTPDERAEMLPGAVKVFEALSAGVDGAEATLGFVESGKVQAAFAEVFGGVILGGPVTVIEADTAEAEDIPFGEPRTAEEMAAQDMMRIPGED